MKTNYCDINYRIDEKTGNPVAVVDVKNIKKYLDMFKVNITKSYIKKIWNDEGEITNEIKNRYAIKSFFVAKISKNDHNGCYVSQQILQHFYDVETYNEDVRIFPVNDVQMFYDVCKKISSIVAHLIGTGLDLNKKITVQIIGE